MDTGKETKLTVDNAVHETRDSIIDFQLFRWRMEAEQVISQFQQTVDYALDLAEKLTYDDQLLCYERAYEVMIGMEDPPKKPHLGPFRNYEEIIKHFQLYSASLILRAYNCIAGKSQADPVFTILYLQIKLYRAHLFLAYKIRQQSLPFDMARKGGKAKEARFDKAKEKAREIVFIYWSEGAETKGEVTARKDVVEEIFAEINFDGPNDGYERYGLSEPWSRERIKRYIDQFAPPQSKKNGRPK